MELEIVEKEQEIISAKIQQIESKGMLQVDPKKVSETLQQQTIVQQAATASGGKEAEAEGGEKVKKKKKIKHPKPILNIHYTQYPIVK